LRSGTTGTSGYQFQTKKIWIKWFI
jgi:hypothetical protein